MRTLEVLVCVEHHRRVTGHVLHEVSA
jgi:hypothetical protein